MVHQFVTSSMTWRMPSYSWRHILQSRRIRKLRHGSNYPCGPFKHTLSNNIVLKNVSSFGLEHWEKKRMA